MSRSASNQASRAAHGERGIYFTLLAGVFFVILAVVGLAVDGGFAYRSQLYLQGALDMAALRGTSHVLENVHSNTEVLLRSQRLIFMNLRLANFSAAAIAAAAPGLQTSIIPAGAREGVRASGSIESPSMIMRLIRGMPQLLAVAGNSAARSRTLSLMMVLDRSGSMAFGIGGGFFANRMAAVRFAAHRAVDDLQPGDQIGLVHYGTDVVAYGEGVVGSNFEHGLSAPLTALNAASIRAEMHAAIDTMNPTSATNTWASLKKGADRMQEGLLAHSTASDPARARTLLFLTDGYPCCTHGWGPDPNAPHDPTQDLIQPNNYTRCENDEVGYQELNQARAERFQSNAPAAQTYARSRDKAQMVYYNHTINAAIYAQRLGFSVNVIGMGTRDTLFDPGPAYPLLGISLYPRPALQLTVGRNPYQNFRDAGPVKEIFLANVANDQSVMANPPSAWLPSAPPPPPSERPYFWDFPCTVVNPGAPTEQIVTGQMRSGDPRGLYRFAETGPQVNQFFDEIILNSRIRYVE